MAPPITQFVDVSVLVEGAQSEVFNFGTVMGVFAHTNGGRLQGPFLNAAGLIGAGFTVALYPEIHYWMATLIAQDNGVRIFYIGRKDVGDASYSAALDAIEAAGQDDFFGVTIDSRVPADIISAATWVELRNNDSIKVGVFQTSSLALLNGSGPVHTLTVGGTATDGNYVSTFTGFGLVSPVVVTTTRSTTPATNALLATAHAAAIQALVATTLANVVASASALGSVVTVLMERDLAVGTLVATSAPAPGTLTHAISDPDVAAQFRAAGFTQSLLFYGPEDTGATAYKDAGAISRWLGFKVDQPAGQGILAFKKLKITPFSPLTPEQALAIAGDPPAGIPGMNANFHGRKLGLAFIWPGITGAGGERFADVTTTILWFIRRSQEAILTLQVGQLTKIGYSRAGILKCVNAVMGVAKNGVRNGHFLGDEGDPGFGPRIAIPKLETIAVADKKLRVLNLTSTLNRLTVEGAIQKIVLVMRLNFGPEA